MGYAYARRPGSDTYSITLEPPDPVTADRRSVEIEQSRMRFARSIISAS